MTAVMLSIRPEWCEKILNGKKTVEIRKSFPKLGIPFKCFIYCTKPIKKTRCGCMEVAEDELYRLPSGEIKCGWSGELMCCEAPYGKDNFLSGKVIAEFNCNTWLFEDVGSFESQDVLDVYFPNSCMTVEQYNEYANGKTTYGWNIYDLKIFEHPKEISDFTPWAGEIPGRKLKRPPQSWCYVEDPYGLEHPELSEDDTN